VLDRTKELAADEAALRLRLKAKDDIILESGDDPEQVRADIAREIAEEKRLGIDGVVPTFGSTGSPPAPSQDQAPVTREPAPGDAAPIGDA
jgi:capsid protein